MPTRRPLRAVLAVLATLGLAVWLVGLGQLRSAEGETDPVLVGAGDISTCASSGDEETAALVTAMPEATVFTAGDNVYPSGTATEFATCYDPSWGQFKDRT